jgi:hypothetical protein
VIEVEARDTGGGIHHQRFCEFNADALTDLHELPDIGFVGVRRAGRVTGRRTNAAVLVVEYFLERQFLVAAKAKKIARFLVRSLGRRFRETVGHGLHQDRRVIVVLANVRLRELLDIVTRRHGKHTQEIFAIR